VEGARSYRPTTKRKVPMKLPNADRAIVAQHKVTGYLLAEDHPIGRAKAAFFMAFGFRVQVWHELAEALLQHAIDYDVAQIEVSVYGRRYIIEGALHVPDGRSPLVRTVWFIEDGDDVPKFVTAYPL